MSLSEAKILLLLGLLPMPTVTVQEKVWKIWMVKR